MLFRVIQRLSISRYLSFARERLAPANVKILIKEMKKVGYINISMLNHWVQLMDEHNRILARGQKLGLSGRTIQVRSRMISSLDMYMLQMQSKYLSEILDDFTSFGERVVKSIAKSPASIVWVVSGAIVMERGSWMRFCQQVMSLLQIIGVDCIANKAHFDSWPDRELLEASAVRARRTFAPFATALPGLPTLSSLLFLGDNGQSAQATRGELPRQARVRRNRMDAASAGASSTITPYGREAAP